MKKSIIIFLMTTVLSVGMFVFACVFLYGQISEAMLTEETITGSSDMANGLTVGFKADSGSDLHWTNSYDYGTKTTKSSFKRGELAKTTESSIYESMRFTGWSTEPYTTEIKYDLLGEDLFAGKQKSGIQAFYDKIQHSVLKSGATETGKIKLKDYQKFYPISFSLQLGTQQHNSSNALTGIKVFDEQGNLTWHNIQDYYEDVQLYIALNDYFKIPVIDNEYQQYKITKLKKYNPRTSLGYKTDIEKPLGQGEDYYEFDPLIVLQEENVKDGGKWVHPDLKGGLAYEFNEESESSYVGKTASEYNLKNRLLFIVNNRTAKGNNIDVSKIKGGYGVYEIPIEVLATRTVSNNPRNKMVANPVLEIDQMKRVYKLDKDAEYVETSLSKDHRYLAILSVKNGDYYVEMVDADNWTSQGPLKVFPASEQMTYTWGEDGSLALTNHKGSIAVISPTGKDNKPYEVVYSGEVEKGLDKALFDTAMVNKENSYSPYKYGIDTALSVATKDGKAALVQNLLIGDSKFNIRNAALECAVINKNGVAYRGRLKSSIVDLDYDMSEKEVKEIREILDNPANGGSDAKIVKNLIQPDKNENWCRW